MKLWVFLSFFHWLPESSESNMSPSSGQTPWQTSCHTLPCRHFLKIFYHYFLLAPIFLHPWLFDIDLSDLQALICPVQLSTCIPWVFGACLQLPNAGAVAARPTSVASVSQCALTDVPQRVLEHQPQGHPPNFLSYQVSGSASPYLESVDLDPPSV